MSEMILLCSRGLLELSRNSLWIKLVDSVGRGDKEGRRSLYNDSSKLLKSSVGGFGLILSPAKNNN